MNWFNPFQIKLPYGDFGKFKKSNFANKIRQALGWRRDEDGNNTTHRQDATQPNGVDIKAVGNICHHYEQDSATADNVKMTTAGTGRTLICTVPAGAGNRGDLIRFEEPDGTLVVRITADGAVSTT